MRNRHYTLAITTGNIRKYVFCNLVWKSLVHPETSHEVALCSLGERAHNRSVSLSQIRRAALALVILSGLTGICFSYAGAAATQHSENYTTRVWQTRDGLPQETVQAFAQTPDGFLWIGTTGGLLRFDGSHFVVFDRGNTPSFRENSVFSLTSGRDGTLWIGTEGGGVIRMRDGNFRQFGATEGLSDGFVRKVLEDRDGHIWIGTDNGLFQLQNSHSDHAIRQDNTSEISAMAVHALAETSDGTVWVGGSRLIAIHNSRAIDYPLIGEYSETRVKSILQTRDGSVWVGTVSGLQRLLPGAAHFERVPGIKGTVRTLCETSEDTLWIGTIGQGAYTLRAEHLTAIGSGKNGGLELPSKTTLGLFEDSERNLWMGTQAGLVRFSHSPIELVSLPNASDSDFETVSRDRDGSLWVASTTLSHLVNGAAIPTSFPSLNGARVRNVFRSHDGSLWIGTDGRGIFHLKGNATEHFTTANGLVNNFVRGVIQSQVNDDLWIATDEGISRISHGVFHNFTVREGLVYFSVRAMLEDRNGDLWIGTDRGLSHLVNDRFEQDTITHALEGEKVWALDQTSDGALWIGTRDNGLYRSLSNTNSPTHFTTEQGLASNSVYQILEDGKGRFWMSGANGVLDVPIAELNQLANDPHTRLSQRFYAVSTGGELTPLYGGTMPAGVIGANGDAWFPSSKGPVHFLPDETKASAVPKVFLDQIVVDGRVLPAQTDRIELAAGNRNFEISYGSILLGPQDAVQFQYKLDGFDRDWRYGSNRRVADYTNLPAGTYTFRVRAFEGEGQQLTERTLQVVKDQYFFLTWWFLGCCSALLALLAWWMHLLKIRRVELAFKAVLDERSRLAREMHDTLIQGCAGVSLLLEAASADGGTGNSGNVELLDYARTQLAAAMDEGRQAVWNLRGQESQDFAETLQHLADRINRSSNVAVNCTVKGIPYEFNRSAAHEITMAGREAIYNALLHANPTCIAVHATFGTEEFALTVVDNGSGFDTTNDPPEGHFGLMGINERVKRLGGRVQLASAVDRGTSVSMSVPRERLRIKDEPEHQPLEEVVR